jgi:hypothetical protein
VIRLKRKKSFESGLPILEGKLEVSLGSAMGQAISVSEPDQESLDKIQKSLNEGEMSSKSMKEIWKSIVEEIQTMIRPIVFYAEHDPQHLEANRLKICAIEMLDFLAPFGSHLDKDNVQHQRAHVVLTKLRTSVASITRRESGRHTPSAYSARSWRAANTPTITASYQTLHEALCTAMDKVQESVSDKVLSAERPNFSACCYAREQAKSALLDRLRTEQAAHQQSIAAGLEGRDKFKWNYQTLENGRYIDIYYNSTAICETKHRTGTATLHILQQSGGNWNWIGACTGAASCGLDWNQNGLYLHPKLPGAGLYKLVLDMDAGKMQRWKNGVELPAITGIATDQQIAFAVGGGGCAAFRILSPLEILDAEAAQKQQQRYMSVKASGTAEFDCFATDMAQSMWNTDSNSPACTPFYQMLKCFYGFYRFNGVHNAGKTMEFEVSQASEEDPHYIAALSAERLQDAGFIQLTAALFPPISVFDGDKTCVLNLFWKAITNPEKVVVNTDPSGAHLVLLAPTCFTIDLFKMHDSVVAARTKVDSVEEAMLKGCLQTALQGEAALPWRHCRLMMLGGGHTGKTSCINALSGAPFEQECQSTVGAEVGWYNKCQY